MSAPPKTCLTASAAEEVVIRDAVRLADPATLGGDRAMARPSHATGLLDFLSDPAVSDPIYDLPRPLTLNAMTTWIADCAAARRRGEGLLILTFDDAGTIIGYSKFSVWPQRSSAELGGALHASLQSSGAGSAGAIQAIGWIFDILKVRLVCLTAATDNIRSARLIDHMGFKRMGERDCVRADGTIRRSLYWEITREEWRDWMTGQHPRHDTD